MNRESDRAWIDCECEHCAKYLAFIHEPATYSKLYDQHAHLCPLFAAGHCNGDCGGCEACDRALGLSPMSPEQLQLEGVGT